MTLIKSMVSSKSNEWETPQDLFDVLNEEFDFTLDPCATVQNTKCDFFFIPEEDGLSRDWFEEVVFMNPPYGRQVGKWIKKAYEESLKGAIVVCLIPATPDRSFWHDYIFPYAVQIRFLRGRLKFGGMKDPAPFPSAIIIFAARRHYYHKIKYYPESICKNLNIKDEKYYDRDY